MQLPKSWKDVGSIKAAFIPKRRGEDRQQRDRRPKTKKPKRGSRKKEKVIKPKKSEAHLQATNTRIGSQFGRCLPLRSFELLPEDLAQPRPWQSPSSLERVIDHGSSAASVRPTNEAHAASEPPSASKSPPNTNRSYTKTGTWSSTLSSAGSSLSFAASKIKDVLLRRRHTDPSQAVSSSRPKSTMQQQKRNSMPILSSGITEEDQEIPMSPRKKSSATTPLETAASTPEPSNKVSKSGSGLEILRERLKKRAATSKEFNKIWESEGLPHLRKTLTDNYNGDYSITIQFNYTSSKRFVEVMTPNILPHNVHQEAKRNVLPCFEKAPQLMVEIHFLIGTVSHTADVIRASQESEDHWVDPRNPSKHLMPICGDSIGVEGKDGAATLGPAVKLGNNKGWLVNWHLFEGIHNWEILDGTSGVPDQYLVHPAPNDCPKNESPKRIAKLHAHSGLMYQTCRQSESLRLFATDVLQDEQTTMNVVTDWAFCIANGDERPQNRLRYAPSGIEFDEVPEPLRGGFIDNPQLELIETSGRSSGFRYAVVCETPAEVRQMLEKPTREWYLEKAEGIGPTFDWACEGPGIPGDSGAAVVHEQTACILGQIWGRNRYGGSEDDQRVTYFTHIVDLFDDISDCYPTEGPLSLILDEYRPHPDTNLHNGLSTPKAPRSTSTLDTLVRSTIGDGDDKLAIDKLMAEGPSCGMENRGEILRRSAAKALLEDDGIMMRRNSTLIAT